MPCCALLHLCARRKKTGIWCIEQYSSTRPGASIPVQLVQDLEGFSIVDAVSVFCVFCGAFVLLLHAILCCNLCGSFSFMILRAHKHTDTHTFFLFAFKYAHCSWVAFGPATRALFSGATTLPGLLPGAFSQIDFCFACGGNYCRSRNGRYVTAMHEWWSLLPRRTLARAKLCISTGSTV